MVSTIAVDSQSGSFVDAPDTAALTSLSGQISNDRSLFLARPMSAVLDARSSLELQSIVHFGDVQHAQRGEHVQFEEWSTLVRSVLSSHAATASRDSFAWFDRPGYSAQQPRQALDLEHDQPGQYVERRGWPTPMWSLFSAGAARAVPDAISWFGQPEYAGQQPGVQALDVKHDQLGQYGERRGWLTAMRSLLSLRAAAAVPDALYWSSQSGQIMEFWVDRVRPIEPLFVCLGTRSPTPLVARNRELVETLEHLHESGDYYVYPGGQIPNRKAFDDARRFIESLPTLRIVPTIALIVDGEVNFSWDTDGVHIDLGFHGDGEGGSYFAKDDSGRKYYCDSFAPDELPDEILRLII